MDLESQVRDQSLIEETTATFGSTIAREFAAGVFEGELVVVGEFFPPEDPSQGENDNMLLAFDVDYAGVAVGLAGVVDEAGGVAMHRGIHHIEVINAEHVASNALQGRKGELKRAPPWRIHGAQGCVVGILGSGEFGALVLVKEEKKLEMSSAQWTESLNGEPQACDDEVT